MFHHSLSCSIDRSLARSLALFSMHGNTSNTFEAIFAFELHRIVCCHENIVRFRASTVSQTLSTHTHIRYRQGNKNHAMDIKSHKPIKFIVSPTKAIFYEIPRKNYYSIGFKIELLWYSAHFLHFAFCSNNNDGFINF